MSTQINNFKRGTPFFATVLLLLSLFHLSTVNDSIAMAGSDRWYTSEVSTQVSTEAATDSLDHYIGRMLMIGFRGMTLQESDHLLRDLQQYHLGGVILFDYDVPTRTPSRNIESPYQLKHLIEEVKQATDIELLVAVDQEGGRVARLKEARGFFRGRSAEALTALWSTHPDSVEIEVANQANQLRDLGFNVNFSPVVDVNVNPDNPVIGGLQRSFSENPDRVTMLAKLTLNALSDAGLTGVLKHYPGHGSSMNDSHLGVTEVTQTWSSIELSPYRNLIDSGHARAIMSAHVFHAGLDSLYPGTLSYYVNTALLREDLGFEGVLFSDDLQMGAIRDQFSLEETVILAVNSGIDVLVFGNNSIYDPEIVPKVQNILRKAVAEGTVPLQRLKESSGRIEKLLR